MAYNFLPSCFVPNSPVGGHGGREFQAYNDDPNQQVKKAEFWVKYSKDWESWFLSGIRITWTDETESQIYGTDEGNHEEFTFQPGETVSTMTIWSCSRTDRIMWTTNKGYTFEASPNDTTKISIMDVGSGLLAGFMGAAEKDIYRLAPIFWKFRRNQPNIRENFRVGGNGGTPFWGCRTDSGLLVKKVEFWVGFSEEWKSHFLRGMKITWTDGIESRIYGTDKGNHEDFTFQPGETISTMILWGCSRTDRIMWTTSKGRTFEASPNKTTELSNMQVGGGRLAGFEGASGYDIDCLAPIFLT